MMYGTAGTGKTFLALYFGLLETYKRDNHEKVVIFRSSVATREQGFLPGSAAAKMKVYEEPYQRIVADLFDREGAYHALKQRGFIQFSSSSYLRGSTIDDAVVILDEFQNCNWGEIKTVLTRVGDNCRVIICGDMRQTDLDNARETSGGARLMEVCKRMPRFDFVEFFKEDILRSGFVKDFLGAVEELSY